MSDVARAAGVSRQTVYNEFGTRQALVQAYVLREIEALIGEVEAHVRAHADDARAALSGAFALFLKLASDEPLVRIIVRRRRGRRTDPAAHHAPAWPSPPNGSAR